MPAIFASPELNYVDVLNDIGANPQAVEEFVVLTQPYFDQGLGIPVIDQLSQHTGNVPFMDTTNRTWFQFRQDDAYPTSTILSRTISGANLVLGLPAGFNQQIPVGNLVASTATNCYGKVILSTSNSVTISFVVNSNGNTSFQTADFPVNGALLDRAPFNNPYSIQSRTLADPIPTRFQNTIGILNNTAEVFEEDMYTLSYLKTINGVNYAAGMKDGWALTMMYNWYITQKLYGNVPAVLNTNFPIGASLVNQIVSMGGMAETFSGGVTETLLMQWIRTYNARGGSNNKDLVFICGDEFAAGFQTALKGYLTYAGSENTFGVMKFDGINMMMYGFGGKTIRLYVEPLFGNSNMWGTSGGYSNMSNSAIGFAAGTATTLQGGNIVPYRKRYFGAVSGIKRNVRPGKYKGLMQVNDGAATTNQFAYIADYSWEVQPEILNPNAWLYLSGSNV